MRIRVSVPATSANLGPGYDVWGIALNLKNVFSAEVVKDQRNLCEFSFNYSELVEKTSEKKISIPNNENNLFAQGYKIIFEKCLHKPLPVKVHCEINIPPERGLGASSTAILAGMVVANEVIRENYGEAYSLEQIFDFASEIEGHPDNIAPALFGGWILSVRNPDSQRYQIFRLPFLAPVSIAGIIPHITLNTQKARSVVRENLPLDKVIAHGSRMALLVYLLGKKELSHEEKQNFYLAFEDEIHQKARANFIPGMYETFSYWRSLGCYGAFLSGAGTTLLGLWDGQFNFSEVDLAKELVAKKILATPIFLKLDPHGILIEKLLK